MLYLKIVTCKKYIMVETKNNNEIWWTAPAQSENGKLIMVTGRKDVACFRNNPKFSIRVEVKWVYDGDSTGMPDAATSEMMEKATEALQKELRKDPSAVLTGIFTGDNQREWIFYTLSTHIFQKKINEALSDLPDLPLEIYCENDPEWAAYDEMAEAEIKMD